METSKKLIRLTAVQSYTVAVWLHAHAEELAKGQWTAREIADLLRQDSSPDLHRKHIYKLIKQHGLAFKQKKVRKASKPKSAAIRRRYYQAFAEQFKAICDELDLPLDPSIQYLIDNPDA